MVGPLDAAVSVVVAWADSDARVSLRHRALHFSLERPPRDLYTSTMAKTSHLLHPRSLRKAQAAQRRLESLRLETFHVSIRNGDYERSRSLRLQAEDIDDAWRQAVKACKSGEWVAHVLSDEDARRIARSMRWAEEAR